MITVPIKVIDKGEGERLHPTGEGGELSELAGAGAIVKGGESGSPTENSWRQNCDGRVVIMPRVQVRASGKCVGFVRLTRNMDQYIVVVCEAGNEASDSSSDVLWVGVVLEVLVVCIDGDRFGRAA
jgi:hypothetical protein